MTHISLSSPGGSSSAGATDHGALTGLSDDDHLQYLLVNGARAMSADLNLGGNSIANVNLVDGVDVSAHAARHLPAGVDPITTAAAVGLTSTSTNTEGTANSLARSDHTHQVTGFIRVIDKSVVTLSTTAVGPTDILSYSVPGGTLGTTNLIRLRMSGIWTNASGAGRSVTVTIVFGGVTIWADTTLNLPTGNTIGWDMTLILASNNSVTAQTLSGLIFHGGVGDPTTGVAGDLGSDEIESLAVVSGTAAANSAIAQTLSVSVTFSGTGITWDKYYHTIEAL